MCVDTEGELSGIVAVKRRKFKSSIRFSFEFRFLLGIYHEMEFIENGLGFRFIFQYDLASLRERI